MPYVPNYDMLLKFCYDHRVIFLWLIRFSLFVDGFAWADDENDPSAVYKGNNLFFVSLYDHMYVRGYVENIPSAPMCGVSLFYFLRKIIELCF